MPRRDGQCNRRVRAITSQLGRIKTGGFKEFSFTFLIQSDVLQHLQITKAIVIEHEAHHKII